MRYYLTGEDGNRYGPAEEPVLRTWAAQGRITPNTMLEPEFGGQTLPAGSMPGFQFPPAVTPYMQAPNPYHDPYATGYAQPFTRRFGGTSWEIQAAWLIGFVACGLELCCLMGGFLAGVGVVVSVIALIRGRSAFGPLILNAAIVALHVFLVHMASG